RKARFTYRKSGDLSAVFASMDRRMPTLHGPRATWAGLDQFSGDGKGVSILPLSQYAARPSHSRKARVVLESASSGSSANSEIPSRPEVRESTGHGTVAKPALSKRALARGI